MFILYLHEYIHMYLYACTTCPTLLSPLNPLRLDITEHFRS